MRYNYVLSVVAVLAAAAPSQSWTQISPLTVPSVRRAGAMAFDNSGNRLLMYGGVAPGPGTILSETWSYNGQWTLLTPTGGAVGRWGHQMVRNPLLNRIITFGGRSPTISGLANDTYSWSGSAWSTLPTTNPPSPRYLYGLAYDSVRNKVVLFGGRAALATVGDTWELDMTGATNVWQQIQVATSPPPREEMLMVFDTFTGRTLLFGGFDRDTNTILGDMWAYDGTNWTPLEPVTMPSPRYRMASAFDSYRQRTVMYGGYDGNQILSETYEFLVDNWFPVTASGTGSVNATEMYAGYDPIATRRKFVTFGGVGVVFSNQTHEFSGGLGGAFEQFGPGCATSAGVADIIAAAPPRLGQTLNLTFSPLSANTNLVLIAVGLATVPPLDLGFLGLPGCNLLVSPDQLAAVVAGGGSAAYGLAIPNQPNLLNQSIYFQGFMVDLTLANFLIGSSRSGRAILGL